MNGFDRALRAVNPRILSLVRSGLGAIALALTFAAPPQYARAQGTMPAAAAQVPMLDPWVPPYARRPSTAPPTQGAALREQVERKLKQGFDAADTARTGTLTREQASAAGLGYVARHFDEIDRGRTGAVRFEDVKRFMRERGAQLN
jgi:hypothetical protein